MSARRQSRMRLCSLPDRVVLPHHAYLKLLPEAVLVTRIGLECVRKGGVWVNALARDYARFCNAGGWLDEYVECIEAYEYDAQSWLVV